MSAEPVLRSEFLWKMGLLFFFFDQDYSTSAKRMTGLHFFQAYTLEIAMLFEGRVSCTCNFAIF